jgi:APA family basic amino acid/polyamine antiporter
MDSGNTAKQALRRSLGLWACTLMGVGVILGAGIYALVGKAAGLAGSAVWMSFVAASIVAGFTGLSYAELASFIPRAGGEYHYALRAYGRRIAFLVSWLLLGGLSIAAAAVSLGFGGYLEAMTGLPTAAGALLVIVLCTAMLLIGIRESVILAGACTALEVVGLLVVIVLGAPHLGDVDLLEMPHGLAGVGSAAILVFFAFIGFEEIVQLAEETRDPARTMPRALLLSIAISTLLYVLVAIAAISVVGWSALGESDSPLADVAEMAVGARSGMAIALIALFSTFNTVLVLLMSASRLVWGVAEDGALPGAVAQVLPGRRTPWLATLVVAAIAALVVIVFERIESVAELTNFALFVTFLMMNGAVVVLRFREPDAPRPFRVPGAVAGVPIVPVLGILSVLGLMSQTRLQTALVGASLVASGLLMQWAFAKRSAREPGT